MIKKTKRIPLPKRIAMKCLECSDSAKEVTLCQVFDCSLWDVRFGYPFGNKEYMERMNAAKKRYYREFKDMADMGINTDYFFTKGGNT